MGLTNTLPYYNITTIAAVKSFIVQIPGFVRAKAGNTKGGSITVLLTSYLTALD